jgi:hypothetical protein
MAFHRAATLGNMREGACDQPRIGLNPPTHVP